jgi:hypothetical protein
MKILCTVRQPGLKIIRFYLTHKPRKPTHPLYTQVWNLFKNFYITDTVEILANPNSRTTFTRVLDDAK